MAFHNIELLPSSHIYVRGRFLLGPPHAALDERRLIEAACGRRVDAPRTVDLTLTAGDDRVVEGIPLSAQISGDLRLGAPGRQPT